MTEIDDIDIIEMYTDFNESRNEFKMQQDDDQYDLKSETKECNQEDGISRINIRKEKIFRGYL